PAAGRARRSRGSQAATAKRRWPRRAIAAPPRRPGASPSDRFRNRVRCRVRPLTLHAPLEREELGEVEEGRPEDDEEHRREDEGDRREEHLDRSLHRFLLGEQLPLETGVARLDAENPAERDPEL